MTTGRINQVAIFPTRPSNGARNNERKTLILRSSFRPRLSSLSINNDDWSQLTLNKPATAITKQASFIDELVTAYNKFFQIQLEQILGTTNPKLDEPPSDVQL